MAASPIHSYVFTDHALAEIVRRKLDVDTVKNVLNRPESRFGVRAGRDVLQSRALIENRIYLIRVFVDIDREPAEVVTAYRTSKIGTYGSET